MSERKSGDEFVSRRRAAQQDSEANEVPDGWSRRCFICLGETTTFGYMMQCPVHTSCYKCLKEWLTERTPHCPMCKALVTKIAPCKNEEEARAVVWKNVEPLELEAEVFTHLDVRFHALFNVSTREGDGDEEDDGTFTANSSCSESASEECSSSDRPHTPPSIFGDLSRGPNFQSGDDDTEDSDFASASESLSNGDETYDDDDDDDDREASPRLRANPSRASRKRAFDCIREDDEQEESK